MRHLPDLLTPDRALLMQVMACLALAGLLLGSFTPIHVRDGNVILIDGGPGIYLLLWLAACGVCMFFVNMTNRVFSYEQDENNVISFRYTCEENRAFDLLNLLGYAQLSVILFGFAAAGTALPLAIGTGSLAVFGAVMMLICLIAPGLAAWRILRQADVARTFAAAVRENRGS